MKNLHTYLKNNKNYDEWKRKAKIAFSIIFLLVIIAGGKRFIQNFNISDLADLLKSFSLVHTALLAVMGMFAVWLTFLYDFTVLRAMHIKIKINRIMKIAWIATSFNNIAGFGGIGGATARVLLYKNNDVSSEDVQKISFYIIPSAVTGLGFLMLLSLFGITPIEKLVQHYRWINLLMIGFIIYVPIYCWFTDIRGSVFNINLSHKAKDNGTRIRIRLSLVSSLDWLMAGLVFAFITSGISDKLTVAESIGIFAVAAAAGIVSMIPAGIGSFDLMLVKGLLSYGIQSHEAFAALLLFRFFYYALPAIVALLLSAGEMSGILFKPKHRKRV